GGRDRRARRAGQKLLDLSHAANLWPGEDPTEKRAEVAAARDGGEVVDLSDQPEACEGLEDSEREGGAPDASAGKRDAQRVVGGTLHAGKRRSPPRREKVAFQRPQLVRIRPFVLRRNRHGAVLRLRELRTGKTSVAPATLEGSGMSVKRTTWAVSEIRDMATHVAPQAADVLGRSPRSILRLRWKLEHFGYAGLFDRRRQRPSANRAPVAEVQRVLALNGLVLNSPTEAP